MNITQVLTISDDAFSKMMAKWAENMSLEVIRYDSKEEESLSTFDGIILLHENHSIDKHISEQLNFFDAKGKAVGKIDINGTLSAAMSNISLWREKNKCKKILFLGNENVAKNANVERFLEELKGI